MSTDSISSSGLPTQSGSRQKRTRDHLEHDDNEKEEDDGKVDDATLIPSSRKRHRFTLLDKLREVVGHTHHCSYTTACKEVPIFASSYQTTIEFKDGHITVTQPGIGQSTDGLPPGEEINQTNCYVIDTGITCSMPEVSQFLHLGDILESITKSNAPGSTYLSIVNPKTACTLEIRTNSEAHRSSLHNENTFEHVDATTYSSVAIPSSMHYICYLFHQNPDTLIPHEDNFLRAGDIKTSSNLRDDNKRFFATLTHYILMGMTALRCSECKKEWVSYIDGSYLCRRCRSVELSGIGYNKMENCVYCMEPLVATGNKTQALLTMFPVCKHVCHLPCFETARKHANNNFPMHIKCPTCRQDMLHPEEEEGS